MILLTANGLSSNPLMDEARTFLRGEKAALVVTADNIYKEKDHHVPELTRQLEALGMKVTCFDFDVQSPKELLKYDAVQMIGGNPYYLLYSIRKNNYITVLREFAEHRILMGCSAGALVLTPTLALIDRYTPEMNTVGLRDLSALGFTKVQILPHYSQFLDRFAEFESTCASYEREHGLVVIRLDDGEGVLIKGKSCTVIRD